MLNNEALDVVIGIVLVYLLYSLLVTILGEFVSTKLGLRARLLRVAVERMLNDGYYQQLQTPKFNSFYRWLQSAFLYEADGFKSSFAGRFYEYPAIKFLSRMERQYKGWFNLSKPSYFSASYFADTLVDMLKEKSSGLTDEERIGYTLKYNTQHIQTDTLKIIGNHFKNAGGDTVKFKANLIQWFNETMDRCNGWFKRKLQLVLFLLGIIVATSFNVDSIGIIKILAKDKQARQQLVDLGVKLSRDSFNRHSAPGDKAIIQGEDVVDSGLAHVTRDIDAANYILGLGWHNVVPLVTDTASLVVKPVLYGRFRQFEQLTNTLDKAERMLPIKKDSLMRLQRLLTDAKLDVLIRQSGLANSPRPLDAVGLQAKIGDTLELKLAAKALQLRIYRDSIDKIESRRQLEAYTRPYLPLVKESNKFKKIGESKNTRGTFLITFERKVHLGGRISSAFSAFLSHLPGLLITALALSLGAPFWFDLLNKLVSIRAVGIKPGERKEESVAAIPVYALAVENVAAAIAAPAGDSSEVEFDKLSQDLQAEQGIYEVAIIHDPPGLQVAVADDTTKAFLENKYLPLWDGQLPVSFVVGHANTLHSSAVGAQICNKACPARSGTLGAFLKKKGCDEDFLISCWHVLKDDTRYQETALTLEILQYVNAALDQIPIGIIVDGFLSDKIDSGIVKCTSGGTYINSWAGVAIKKQHRAVTVYDAMVSTPVKIIGQQSRILDATIFRYKLNVSLPYDDGADHMINDVFSMTGGNDEENQSAPTRIGDSGAVVIEAATGIPLGMIIGGNSTYSYAIKFSNLFDLLMPYHGYYFNV